MRYGHLYCDRYGVLGASSLLITLFGRRAFDIVGGVIGRELLRPIFGTAMNIFPGEGEKIGFAICKGVGSGDIVGGVISRELLRPIFATAMNIFPGGAKKLGSPSVKEEVMVWQGSSLTGSCKQEGCSARLVGVLEVFGRPFTSGARFSLSANRCVVESNLVNVLRHIASGVRCFLWMVQRGIGALVGLCGLGQ